MFRYLVLASVAIYGVLTIFGDEARRPEVARQAQGDVTGVTLAAFIVPESQIETRTLSSGITQGEAIQIAMEAGRTIRAERETTPLLGAVAPVAEENSDAETVAAPLPTPDMWFVTGTTVNLRSGPGTSNDVVARVGLGDAAEVLADRDGWYQIRTGETQGWIFGKFLSTQKPG